MKCGCGVLVFCTTIIIQLTWAKPGDYDYGSYGAEYVGADIGIGGGASYGSIGDSSAALIATPDLKPASTFDTFGYGSPEPSFPFYPIRSYGGWGWKQPQPIIAPIPVIKHIPVPILPFGWGWQNPGIF